MVGVLQSEDFSIPDSLKQYYVKVQHNWRLAALAGILKKCSSDPGMKAIVFINFCLSVDFHAAFFRAFNFKPHMKQNYVPPKSSRASKIPDSAPTIRDPHASTDNDEIGAFSPFLNCHIFRIHGNVEQIDRANTISKFTASPSAVLFCTDVAARGLDIPNVTAIIQYDPPIDTEDYVH